MKRMLLISLFILLVLAACSPFVAATPTSTPIPVTLNNANEIKQYLTEWVPDAQKIGYDFEILDVTSEKDANGDITSWVISIKYPVEPYREGVCVAPIMGMVVLVKNYTDSGRDDQLYSIAPATLETIKTICYDSNLVEQQTIIAKFGDVVSMGKGRLTADKMLMRLTLEP
jgi:uncharacterized protein YceK